MGTGKDLFAMTKRERRGTIVVLLVIAILLILSFALKRSKPSVPDDVKESEMLQFEAEVDSVRVIPNSHKAKPKPSAEKGKVHKKRKKPTREQKPKTRPRNVDPLPQF